MRHGNSNKEEARRWLHAHRLQAPWEVVDGLTVLACAAQHPGHSTWQAQFLPLSKSRRPQPTQSPAARALSRCSLSASNSSPGLPPLQRPRQRSRCCHGLRRFRSMLSLNHTTIVQHAPRLKLSATERVYSATRHLHACMVMHVMVDRMAWRLLRTRNHRQGFLTMSPHGFSRDCKM